MTALTDSLSRAPSLATVLTTVGYIALIGLGVFIYRLIKVRLLVRSVQSKYGIPIMPHNFIFGHLPYIIKTSIKHSLPPDATAFQLFDFLRQEFPPAAQHGVIYMDPWPMGPPIACVVDPEMMAQFTQDVNLPKYFSSEDTPFKMFSNNEDLVHLEGQDWKQSRAMFNPGFSTKNLMSLVPRFMEEVVAFRDRLGEIAESGETVQLEGLTTLLTIDMVAQAVLGRSLHSQQQVHPMVTAMSKQVSYIYFSLDFKKLFNPFRLLLNAYYGRIFRNSVIPYVQDAARMQDKREGPKTVLNLALDAHLKSPDAHNGQMSTAFLESSVYQIKMFMFAGHDSTATTLAYIFYILSIYPEILSKVRQEHDQVFTKDTTQAKPLIEADPSILNKLPYTSAVIKEVLRMYPPFGGTVRRAPKDFHLIHAPTGQKCPLHGFMVNASSSSSARDGTLFHEADKFFPERWLVRDDNDPFKPPKFGFRPFEMGPRNCIGQELVWIELRLVMALTLRDFDLHDMYGKDAKIWRGIRGYQILVPEHPASAHIKGGLPVKVTKRKA